MVLVTPSLGESIWTDLPPGRIVLIPIGSTEQHGPHLPLAADTIVATAVAEGVAARLNRAIVAPVVAYGASGEHAGFPGTLSIGLSALEAVLVELVRSATVWAAGVVLVNGHGGNATAVDAAVRRLVAEGRDVAWVPCAAPGGDAHAGRTETSLLLHLAPALVDEGSAAAGDVRPIRDLLPELRARGVRAVSANGVLGDPAGASAEEGARILAAMIDGAVRLLEQGR
ncbi:mycofactocin biosynthesis peptidyl-dipeptidase MftE [uncultured Amnibacterium sp.]|uniref:mycofactocin biosynthesis peptidyl-dipeptidase MftE n=1 Tax=uncultured Amnibacterium sp. TaxID=1631851 RepID=UPI0035CC1D8A